MATVLIGMAVLGQAALQPAAAAPARVVKAASTPVSESAQTATITLHLKHKTHKRLRVNYQTVSGTAVAGQDFIPAAGHVSIKKHQATASINIPLIDDQIVESPESFTVELNSGAAKVKPHTVVVNIIDDDTAKPPTPPATGTRLTGTVTFHLLQKIWQNDMELGPPGQHQRITTLTMNLSLRHLAGAWVDDGTSTWSYTSDNKLWFVPPGGSDGDPYACADNPEGGLYYRHFEWNGSPDGSNYGPFVTDINGVGLHKGYVQLTGYDPTASGSPVLKTRIFTRPDYMAVRPADSHICDISTADHPNPIIHEGSDPYLDAYAQNNFEAKLADGIDGLAAQQNGANLDFTNSSIHDYHQGSLSQTTGHYDYEENDNYTISGTLSLH